MTRRKWFVQGAQLLLSGICLAWAVQGIDYAKTGALLISFPLTSLAAVFAIASLELLAPALRLGMLTDGRCNLASALEAHALGIGINLLLPAKLGEAARIYHVRSKSGLQWSTLVGLIFWERFMDINVLMLFGVLVSTVMMPSDTGMLLAALTGILWVGLLFVRFRTDLFLRMVGHIPQERPRLFIENATRQFQQTFRVAFILRLVWYTLVVWVCYALMVILSLLCLGIHLNPAQFLLFFVATAGAMAIPSAPGSLGVYEATAVAVLTSCGIAKDTAFATSVVLHILTLLPGFIITMGLLITGRFHVDDIRKGMQKTPQRDAAPPGAH